MGRRFKKRKRRTLTVVVAESAPAFTFFDNFAIIQG